MSTINQLSSTSEVISSDQVPIYSSTNGDARKASMATLKTFFGGGESTNPEDTPWGQAVDSDLALLKALSALNVISVLFPFDLTSGYGVVGDAQINLATGDYACKGDNGWVVYAPTAGLLAYDAVTPILYANTGVAWVDAAGGGGGAVDTLYTANGTIAGVRTVSMEGGVYFRDLRDVEPFDPTSTFAADIIRYDPTLNAEGRANLKTEATGHFSQFEVVAIHEDNGQADENILRVYSKAGQSESGLRFLGRTYSKPFLNRVIRCEASDFILGYMTTFSNYTAILQFPNSANVIRAVGDSNFQGIQYGAGEAIFIEPMFTYETLIHKGYADKAYQHGYTSRYEYPSSTGFVSLVPDSPDNFRVFIEPTGVFADGELTMPATVFAVDKQEILVTCTQAVTTFVVNGNGSSVVGAPTTLAAGDFFKMMFGVVTNTWYRVG